MEFLFVLGGIAYYIYQVYKETQKRKEQSTPQSNNRPKKKSSMQSIEDLLKEIEKKANTAQEIPKSQKITTPKPKEIVLDEPVSELDVLEYNDVFTKETDIDRLEDQYESIMQSNNDVDSIYAFEEIDDYSEEDHKHYSKKLKLLTINGKKVNAKDAFVYSLIFDRKY